MRITRKGAKTVECLMELALEHERSVVEPFGLLRAEEVKNTRRQMIELHVSTPGETTRPTRARRHECPGFAIDRLN